VSASTAPITFTLDLEDYAPAGTPARANAIVPRVLELLSEHAVTGTFFIVGELAEAEPALVRTIAGAGHEIALHAYRHVPLPRLDPATFRAEAKRGRDVLEDLAGAAVTGFRAPTFSLVPESRWAVDELTDLGFAYSSSVLPARSPLYGWPGLLRRPFCWPTGLVELPCPVTSFGPRLANPYLGGVYFRVLPWSAVRVGLARSHPDEVLWLYCHPYDFDPDEPFVPRGDVGRIGNRLLWLNRSRMATRVGRVLAGRAGDPLNARAERVRADPLTPTRSP
jgi:polysaccharide deacetylase family protein (PEP-CTERM system associated)